MSVNLEEQLYKEKATTENRHWVRLTSICNNNCLFCLDQDDGLDIKKHFTFKEIEKDLIEGKKNAASRAILSGGEASVHPDFIEIVKTAKNMKYDHVQVISNGRMFCYNKFLDDSLRAGLDEITFSIHGDTKKLHDKLTGAPGSYEQAMKGIKNALKKSGLIVSVDICINKMNYKRLPLIVAKLFSMGVREFDLLHIVPFGRAWQNKDIILYKFEKAEPYIKKVLEFSKHNSIYIWTNRLPASYLENFENLIQDPYKLHSEIKGQKEMMDQYVFNGKMMDCFGERCKDCYMNNFCESLIKWKNRIDSGELKEIFFDLGKIDFDFFSQIINKFKLKRIHLKSRSIEELREYINVVDNNIGVIIEIENEYKIEKLKNIIKKFKSLTLILSKKKELKFLNDENLNFYIEINHETEEGILKNLKIIEKKRKSLCFFKKNYLLLSDDIKKSIDLKIFFNSFFKLSTKEFRAINLPFCYNDKIVNIRNEFLDAQIFQKNYKINIHSFVDFFIVNENYIKRLSCKNCVYEKKCLGMNLNYIKNFGFKNLNPKQSI
ncbi:radical SAM protein [Candidatus Parcubacteria bacterium]|nr:radical SAM protein [Candidatus Parcubacteria bacterium]